MNKQANLFAGIAVVVAVSIVAYIGFFKIDRDKGSATSNSGQPQAETNREIFSYVPADTLFFFGGLSTMSFEDAISVMNPGGGWIQHAELSNQLSDEEKKQMPSAALMVNSLMSDYMKLLKEPQSAGSKLGIGDHIDAISYTIGFIPVLRIKLEDSKAFNQFVDAIEKQESIIPTKSVIGDMNLRAYSLDVPGDSNPSAANLIIGSNSQYAIFSLATKIEDEKTRQLIVGASKPEKPLDAIATLQPIKTKYHFHPAYIGYVNHREIMKGITGEGNGEFGRMLDAVINMANQANADAGEDAVKNQSNENTTPPANEKPLEAIRTDACRKEMMALVDAWPQSVFGYTKLEIKAPPTSLEASMIIEGTDEEFMKTMQTLRGYIPKMLLDTSERPAFGFGLGINIDALSPFVAKATQGFISKQYQCDFLAQTKQSLVQSNPAMALGMMSGMVSGIQGVSVTVFDMEGKLDVSQPGAIPEINKIDAMITISSSNPQQLLMMAANMQPGMPPLQLPPDGTPIDLPVPLPIPALAQMKLALKGNHIIAYIGERATKYAESMASEKLEPRGIFAINMDFGKYMSLIAEAARADIEANQDNQPTSLAKKDQAMLDAISKTNMQFVETMDIRKDGIAFDIKMQTN